ncbi:MAG: M20 family metallopeptidase [Thermodesulfobacteriota bacterium]
MPTQTDPLELTRILIQTQTVNPPGLERICADYLGGILETAGYTVRSYQSEPDRTSLIARKGGRTDQKPLCFLGHTDTVPLGSEKWKRDPFGGEIADGRIYGRGSSDMKSGLAAMVAAAVELADRLEGTAGLTLLLVADEETGCTGAADLARHPDLLETAGAMVVGEPTGNLPRVGHKGALWLNAAFSGKSAHGSMPEKGDNAIYKAARAVRALESFRFGIDPHPILGGPTLNVGTITGGTNINSVPDRAVIGIDMRTIPDQDHGDLFRQFQTLLAPDADLSKRISVDGIWTDPNHPWIREVYDLAAPILGETPETGALPYFTDAGILTPAYGGIPTLILGPGEPGLAHQTNEYCRLDRIEQATEIYLEIARRWCGM